MAISCIFTYCLAWMKTVFSFIALLVTITCCGQQPIDQRFEWTVGSLKQVVWVKGNDSQKPLFLFLHGGPGNSVMPYAKKFSGQLYDHFVVVHWDQREVGETLARNSSPQPFSLELLEQDAEQVVDSLLTHFHRQKLYLAGHSWGTALGFHLVRSRPQQIEAFITIGSMIHQQQSERMALELLKKEAGKKNDESALSELRSIDIPFANGEQLYLHRKHLLRYMGSRANLSKDFVLAWSEKWLGVFNEASKINLFETLREVKCPVYFFAGRNDYQTNSYLAEEYYKLLKAPAKGFYWFENAGHSLPSSHGNKMQQIIINQILKSSPGL